VSTLARRELSVGASSRLAVLQKTGRFLRRFQNLCFESSGSIWTSADGRWPTALPMTSCCQWRHANLNLVGHVIDRWRTCTPPFAVVDGRREKWGTTFDHLPTVDVLNWPLNLHSIPSTL
jgi:hypothetical protein